MNYSATENTVDTIDVEAVILGYYEDDHGSAGKFIDSLQPILAHGDFKGKFKQKLLFYNIEGLNSKRLLLVGLGKKEEVNSEKVRVAASLGARALRDLGMKHIGTEALNGNALSTAEGIVLGLYRFDELKTQNLDKLKTIDEVTFAGNPDEIAMWNKGVNMAVGENHGRRLAELPSNYATPTYVANHAKEIMGKLTNVEVIIRDEKWAEKRKMGSFLSVTEGTEEPAKFLEMHYKGGNEDDAPLPSPR